MGVEEIKPSNTQPQDLVAVMQNADKLKARFGEYKDPFGVIVAYGLVDDHFSPLEKIESDFRLSRWGVNMREYFKVHSVSPAEQTVLRDGAGQYFHALHLIEALQSHHLEIKGMKTPSERKVDYKPVDKWQSDLVGDLHEFITGSITKNTLDQLLKVQPDVNIAMKCLGNSIGQTLLVHHSCQQTNTRTQIHPEKVVRNPVRMAELIQDCPFEAARRIERDIKSGP